MSTENVNSCEENEITPDQTKIKIEKKNKNDCKEKNSKDKKLGVKKQEIVRSLRKNKYFKKLETASEVDLFSAIVNDLPDVVTNYNTQIKPLLDKYSAVVFDVNSDDYKQTMTILADTYLRERFRLMLHKHKHQKEKK